MSELFLYCLRICLHRDTMTTEYDANSDPDFNLDDEVYDVTDPRIGTVKDHLPLQLEEPSPTNFPIFTVGQRGGTSFQPRAVVAYLSASHIIYDGGVWRKFDGRVYAPISYQKIRDMVYRAIDACGMNYLPTKTEISNILEGAQALLDPLNALVWPDAEMSAPYDIYENGSLYAFENGIYNTESGELLPFTPYVYATHYVHARWMDTKPNAQIINVLNGIIPDKDTQRFFFEMVGYILYSERMIPPSIFVLYGPGETGKSALHNAICSVLGWESVSQLGLEQLTQRFMTAELEGKLLNVSGESGQVIGPFNRVNGELIKRLSDGQTIKVEQKHGKPYDIRNSAKLLFVSNTVPDFGDTSSGLYRRVHIIPCRKKQKTSDMIYNKMTDDESRSWLAMMAFDAYEDFVARGLKFSDSAKMEVELTAFKSQDAFYDFLQTAFDQVEDTTKYGDAIVDDPE